MSKTTRGNYIFLTWIGDHDPRHVHVYKGKKLVLKWDLTNRVVMKGEMTARLQRIIDELEEEGEL
jgi:hypothetical protein